MFNPFTTVDYPISTFIRGIQQTTLRAFVCINMTEICFDLQKFDSALFALYGVKQPAHFQQMVNKRRGEYLASRYAARIALNSFGIVGFLLKNDSDRAPIWPAGILGSLTHTRRRAVIITAPAEAQRLIGVDAEQLIKASCVLKLSKMIVSVTELNYLKQCELPLTAALTLAFSLKESLYKALYPVLRQFMDFHSAEVTNLQVKTGRACLRLTRNFSSEFQVGRQFNGYFQQQKDEVLTMVVDQPKQNPRANH